MVVGPSSWATADPDTHSMKAAADAHSLGVTLIIIFSPGKVFLVNHAAYSIRGVVVAISQ